MRVRIDRKEFVRVIYFSAKNRKEPYVERVSKLKIIHVDFFTIIFGIPGIMGRLHISWDYFLEQKELLDKSTKNRS